MRLLPGWPRLLLLVAPIVVGLVAAIAVFAYRASVEASTSPASQGANPPLDLPAAPGLLVDVTGAIQRPGLYRLPRGDRVYDAIAAAGGLSADADRSRLPNLAGRLRDGEQIKVPFAKTAGGTATVRVNLNTATLEELEQIPGFTALFAQECLDYRTNFGGFQNTRELVDVLGMSESDYVIVRHHVTL